MSGIADLTYCDIWVMHPRINLIDFVYPYFEICITFIVPRPTLLPGNWYSIFTGFSLKLWLSILTMFCLTAIILHFIIQFFQKRLIELKKFLKCGDIIIEMISILVTGNSVPSSDIPGYSFILTIWSLFSLFVGYLYASNLVSFLTVPNFTIKINTAEDFKNANLSWGAIDSYSKEYLFHRDNPEHQIFFQNFNLDSYDDYDLFMERINRGNYAVLVTNFGDGSAVILKSFDKIPFLKYRIMRKCFYRPFISIWFPYNSPYKNIIEKYIIKLVETGVFQQIKKYEIRQQYSQNWESIYSDSDGSSVDGPQVLTLDHIYSAFILLIFGLSCSILGFIYEFVKFHFNGKNK